MAETVQFDEGTRGEGRSSRGPSWIVGVALIAIGAAFLLQNFGLLAGNWWALLLFIPVAANLVTVASSLREHGGFTSAATGSLVGALVLTVVALIFLLNVDWSWGWPFILVAVGLGLLVGGLIKPKR